MPSCLKKQSIGFRLTGKLPSIYCKQSVYVFIRVSSSFGVKGFLILRVSGNIPVALELYFEVLAPKPKIGKLVTFAYEDAISFIKSL